MEIFAIRHGETEWNLEGREMGHLDSPLTQRGLTQVDALAQRMASLSLDLVYSSDLERALRSAEIIANACGLPLESEPRLRERCMGIFEGLTLDEIRLKFPGERTAFENDRFNYLIPNGESGLQRTERSIRVFSEIAKRHPFSRVAVVTHAGLLGGFCKHVLGVDPSLHGGYVADHASMSVFEYRIGGWKLQTWNDVSHLDGLRSNKQDLPETNAFGGGETAG
jgi:probable phosphoglycerate mutase